jgi:hypothetical protein
MADRPLCRNPLCGRVLGHDDIAHGFSYCLTCALEAMLYTVDVSSIPENATCAHCGASMLERAVNKRPHIKRHGQRWCDEACLREWAREHEKSESRPSAN